MTDEQASSNREIITINVGGCGVNIGQSILEQYCVEKGIAPNGEKKYKTKHDSSLGISFQESSKGKYYARSLFVDLDPYSINMTKNIYKYRNVVHPQYCIDGKVECASNWARGHYIDGKENLDKFNDRLRIIVEECDNFQGTIFNHSLFGGTGGGMGSLILERLAVDYRKKCKFAFEVFFDENKCLGPIQVYNGLLSIHWSLDHTEISIILDNSQLNAICRKQLGILAPRYKNYNNICTKLMSNITAPFRFPSCNDNLMTFTKDMICYPRLHWLMSSMSPIIGKSKDKNKSFNYKDNIQSLTDECTNRDNFFQRINDFDVEYDKYTAIAFNYRGKNVNESLMDINNSIEWMRLNNKFSFVDWSSTDRPSVKYINSATIALPSDDMITANKQVTMVGNNPCISRLFARIANRYDTLYSQRSYVHHLVGWGMYEGELVEAREDLGFLKKDYVHILSHSQNDEDDEDIDNDEDV